MPDGEERRCFLPLYFLIAEKPSHMAQKCVKIVLSEIETNPNMRNKMQILKYRFKVSENWMCPPGQQFSTSLNI